MKEFFGIPEGKYSHPIEGFMSIMSQYLALWDFRRKRKSFKSLI